MTDLPKLQLQYFTFPSLTQPHGVLPRDKRAQACWYFYTIAQHAKEKIGDSTEDQIILEGERWMDTRYEQQALSVAQLYQLESPSEFAKFWPEVKKQAELLGYPTPHHSYTNIMRGRLIT